MKKLTYILLTLLVLSACTGTSRHPQLVAADSLLLSRPDSALTLLRGMSFTDKADRMYHYLLLADACNKCYDTLPSDTILQEVADYYDRHGTPNEQVRAHYLLGCAYRDMGEAPHALNCYQTAVSRADTTAFDCNYRLLMSVYGQMASIFHRQNLPQDELTATKEYGKYALLAKDSFNYISSIEMSVKAYGIMEDTLKVEELIKESQRLYKQLGFPHVAIRENIILIHDCVQRGEYHKAQILMEEYERESQLFDHEGNIAKGREAYYYIKGTYYIKTNRLDSAEYYMRKLLARGDEADAYRGLLAIYQQKKNTDSIIRYARLYEDAVDTLNNMKRTEVVGQMSSMYNYQRFQLIAEQKEHAANQLKWMLTLVVIISAFVLITIIELYHRNRKKKKAEIQQLNNDYGRALLEYNKLSAELERMKQQDGSLIFDKQQEVEELKARLQAYQAALQTNGTSQQLSVFQESSIMQTFRTKSRVSPQTPLPTETEWKRLVSQFSRSLPYAYAALGRDVILSTNELRVCILLLSGFKIADVAVLLDTSPQSITNLKARANNKLFGENSASTLERNLMNTVGLA